MNKIILDQLKQVKVADLSNFDEKNNCYYIKKFVKPEYNIGSCYVVSLPISFVSNNESVIAVNWNHGTSPKTIGLKVYVSKMLGKMLYVDSIGFDLEKHVDLNNLWSGWLSADDITLITAL